MGFNQISPTRLLAVFATVVGVAALSLYLAVEVPVRMPRLPAAEATKHWPYLAAAGVAVVVVSGGTALLASRTAWTAAGQVMIAIFGALTVLQLGHFGEHIAQVVQLIITSGNLKVSHGLLARFDQETLHLTWNLGVWLVTCLLAFRFRRNAWLWITLGVAGFHTVEHIYLYSIYVADPAFYLRGGIDGVLATGGMVGSPLSRPYLHFLYNAIEVGALVIAFGDQVRAQVGEARIRRLVPA